MFNKQTFISHISLPPIYDIAIALFVYALNLGNKSTSFRHPCATTFDRLIHIDTIGRNLRHSYTLLTNRNICGIYYSYLSNTVHITAAIEDWGVKCEVVLVEFWQISAGDVRRGFPCVCFWHIALIAVSVQCGNHKLSTTYSCDAYCVVWHFGEYA